MFDTLEKSSIADRIQGIEKSLKDAVDGLDLKNCTNEELSGLLLSLGDIERICSCTKAMAAHLLAEKNLLSGPSDRSAAHGLASKENIPVSKAKELISVGRCLSGHPMVAKEALDAGLSLAQISCIDGAVELNPKKEAELVQIAKSGSLANLRDACARSKREAIGERAMREKIHSKRYFRCFTDPDGMRHLKAGGNVEDMAYIEAAVELRRKYIFDEAYREGRREPFDAYGFDAFLEVFTEGSGDPILINHPLTELADSSQATETPAAPPAGTVAPSQATEISTNHPGKSIGTIPTSTQATPPAGIPTASQATGISTKHYPPDETQQPYSGDGNSQPDSGYGSSPLPTTTPVTPSAGTPTALQPPVGTTTTFPSRSKNRSTPATTDTARGSTTSRSPNQKNSQKRKIPKRPSYIGSKVIVRIDYMALIRGYPVGDEVSEISGVGPVSPEAVIEMLINDNPFIAAVLTKGNDVLSVVHFGRKPTSKQITALEWLYPSCGVKGCNAALFLEMDHTIPWSYTHMTTLKSLDRLCSYHHDLKTNLNWQLVKGRGKRDFVPPDDPRHPEYKRKSTRSQNTGNDKRRVVNGVNRQ